MKGFLAVGETILLSVCGPPVSHIEEMEDDVTWIERSEIVHFFLLNPNQSGMPATPQCRFFGTIKNLQ